LPDVPRREGRKVEVCREACGGAEEWAQEQAQGEKYMIEAEAIDFLRALLKRLQQSGGLASESSRNCEEVIAWLEERKVAFLNIAGPYDGWC
jgi:hypothetical protein